MVEWLGAVLDSGSRGLLSSDPAPRSAADLRHTGTREPNSSRDHRVRATRFMRRVEAARDEAIGPLPMNKPRAFGGDYATLVEKVHGHLVLARENIAEVPAKSAREAYGGDPGAGSGAALILTEPD